MMNSKVIYSDAILKVSTTGRNLGLVGFIENKSDNTIILLGDKHYSIEAGSYQEIYSDFPDQINLLKSFYNSKPSYGTDKKLILVGMTEVKYQRLLNAIQSI